MQENNSDTNKENEDNNGNQLNENEIELLNSDDINRHETTRPPLIFSPPPPNGSIITTTTTTTNTNDITAPLIIRKLNNSSTQSSIKISIRSKASGEKIETRENDVYENNNENIKKSADTIKNDENNNNTATTQINSNAYRYTTPLLTANSQFKLRYKDPKTGKFIVNIQQQPQATSPNGSLEDGMNNIVISNSNSNNTNQNTSRMATARNTEGGNPMKTTPARLHAVPLFRTDSASRLSKPKSIDTKSSYMYHSSMRDDHDYASTANSYNWKGKGERNPVQMAPDRLYLNTYMGQYENNNRQANSAKIKNIKFQGVSPRFSETRASHYKGSMNNGPPLTTGQVFEHIFDMNKQFLNIYYPQNKKQNSRRNLSRSHTMPGHIALETAATQLSIDGVNSSSAANGQSKRPLKFENPSIYKVSQRSTLSTARTNKSSINNYDYQSNDDDIDTIEIPIILKSPNSVNSYISYLRSRNHGIFRSAKA